MPQTKTNELNVKVLSEEDSCLAPEGVVRSDRLPPPPENFYFGQMQVLPEPEPIAKAVKEQKKK